MSWFGFGGKKLFLLKTANSYYLIEKDGSKWYLYGEYAHLQQSRNKYPLLGTADKLNSKHQPIIAKKASRISDVWEFRGHRVAADLPQDIIATSVIETVFPITNPNDGASEYNEEGTNPDDAGKHEEQEKSKRVSISDPPLTTTEPEGLLAALVGSNAYLLWVHGRNWYLSPEMYDMFAIVAVNLRSVIVKKMADHTIMTGASLIYKKEQTLLRTTVMNEVVRINLPAE